MGLDKGAGPGGLSSLYISRIWNEETSSTSNLSISSGVGTRRERNKLIWCQMSILVLVICRGIVRIQVGCRAIDAALLYMLAGDIVSLPTRRPTWDTTRRPTWFPTRLPTRISYSASYLVSYSAFLLGLPIWESYSGTLLGAHDTTALRLSGEILRIYIGALCPS
jgi:hypothetical protein